MPSPDSIRAEVERFYQQHELGSSRIEDAFAPWYMVQHLGVPPQEAIAQSSDASYDGGIDGYCIEMRGDQPALLHILQAKYTDSDALVRKGFDDLRRGFEVVSQLLTVGPTDMPEEHRVIANLRRDLLRVSETDRRPIEVRGLLIHLLPDQEFWLSRPSVQKAKTELDRALNDNPLAGRVGYLCRGPEQMLEGTSIPPPAQPMAIRFQGVPLDAPGGDQALFGLGHLADLVELHERYRADLFAKNVRMYLARQAAKPKSAASHIEASLDQICTGRMPPSRFAMTHNGVTLSAPRASAPDGGRVVLEPGQTGVFVLNGCQTIYTAWKYYKKKSSAKKPDPSWREYWEAIRLPVRVVLTDDDDRIRRITIGANRQTEIRPSAFWAHDPTQLDLEHRFARLGVYYERQEGAWDELSRSDTKKVEDLRCGVVRMEEQARAIAAADRSLSMDFARSPNRIFDEESAYRRVFKEQNLVSVRLLLFLVNTFEATRFALKDLATDLAKLDGLTPSRFVFPVFRLLVHWIVKSDRSMVEEFSGARMSASPRSEIRYRVRQWLNHHNTGLQQLLPEIWWDGAEWAEATDKQCLERAYHKMRLDKVAVFDGWEELDAQE